MIRTLLIIAVGLFSQLASLRADRPVVLVLENIRSPEIQLMGDDIDRALDFLLSQKEDFLKQIRNPQFQKLSLNQQRDFLETAYPHEGKDFHWSEEELAIGEKILKHEFVKNADEDLTDFAKEIAGLMEEEGIRLHRVIH